ncbi:MAG: tetratricopeptide repeat protein, partial [Acidimicrobiia bacterium]
AFQDLGQQRVKNISEPVHVWRVEGNGGARPAPAPTPESEAARSAIAVMPFENMSDDSEQEYFADGLTEDIITALSSQVGLRLIARHSTFAYKNEPVDLKQVARELDARYVLEGSVRKAGDRVRVTAQLVDATTGQHVWAERYDRDLADIFEVQDEITANIAGRVAPEVWKMEGARTRARAPESLDAWDLHLRALSHYYQTTRSDFAEAERLLRRAIELDPGYEPAHNLLAGVLTSAILRRWEAPEPRLVEEVVREVETAVRLDDNSGTAHAGLALAYGLTGRHAEAVAEGRKSVERNPYAGLCRSSLGYALWLAGDHEEAADHLLRAFQLSPNEPDRYHWSTQLTYVFYLMGRYEAALAWVERSEALTQDYVQLHGIKAATLAQLGRVDEARAALADFLRHLPGMTDAAYRRRLRWKHAADVDHYMEGLSKAGLPAG